MELAKVVVTATLDPSSPADLERLEEEWRRICGNSEQAPPSPPEEDRTVTRMPSPDQGEESLEEAQSAALSGAAPGGERHVEADTGSTLADNPAGGRLGRPGEFITLEEWDRDWGGERRKQLAEVIRDIHFSNSKAMNFQEGDSIEWALWSWNPVRGGR